MGEVEGVCNTLSDMPLHKMAVYICWDMALMVLLNKIVINSICMVIFYAVYLFF